MNSHINIAKIFPKHLFWDRNVNDLDLERDKDYIIPRAVYATTSETFNQDIQRLEDLYPKKDIIDYLKHTKEKISNKVCALVSDRYHIQPFSRFRK